MKLTYKTLLEINIFFGLIKNTGTQK